MKTFVNATFLVLQTGQEGSSDSYNRSTHVPQNEKCMHGMAIWVLSAPLQMIHGDNTVVDRDCREEACDCLELIDKETLRSLPESSDGHPVDAVSLEDDFIM
jgi:hypothetical protein